MAAHRTVQKFNAASGATSNSRIFSFPPKTVVTFVNVAPGGTATAGPCEVRIAFADAAMTSVVAKGTIRNGGTVAVFGDPVQESVHWQGRVGMAPFADLNPSSGVYIMVLNNTGATVGVEVGIDYEDGDV